MTDLLPVEPDALAVEADPTGYMLVVLNRAKTWLVEAQNIETVREAKAIAVGYEAVIREKEMAADAQLAATEIVRRCERRIGQLVKEGQERGEIRSYGQHEIKQEARLSVDEVLAGTSEARTQHYAMADSPPEQFEQAIEEAKAEGNLSRANVVRKVKGESRTEERERIVSGSGERSEWHRRKRHLDSNRMLRSVADALEAALVGTDLIDVKQLDDEKRIEAIDSINVSMRAIRALLRRLAQ